jgi:hypothetical protein
MELADLPEELFAIGELDGEIARCEAWLDSEQLQFGIVWTDCRGAERWISKHQSVTGSGVLQMKRDLYVGNLVVLDVNARLGEDKAAPIQALLLDAPPSDKRILDQGDFSIRRHYHFGLTAKIVWLTAAFAWPIIEPMLQKYNFIGEMLAFLRVLGNERNPADLLVYASILEDVNRAATYFVSTPCTRCGEKVWECLSISHNRVASTWRCRYCGRTEIVRTELNEVSLQASRPPIPKHVQREVWRRDMGRCVECGSRENLEFDHIIPVAKGGATTARQLQLLCQDCNRRKSHRDPGTY